MRVGENAGWSLSKLLSATDMEAGDYLVLVFDVRNRTGVALLGTQELLFDFSEEAPSRDISAPADPEEDDLEARQTA
jgi:hypothetical protein